MPSAADIVRDSINEFSRVQDWMELCKENSPETYHAMHKRYIELKVTLTSLGVNITELDRNKNRKKMKKGAGIIIAPFFVFVVVFS